jgi:hypothetical protein
MMIMNKYLISLILLAFYCMSNAQNKEDIQQNKAGPIRFARFQMNADSNKEKQNDTLFLKSILLVSTLQGKDADPRSATTAESVAGVQDLTGASLQQNGPNPFSQSTLIRYTLPKTDRQAQLVIRNTAGNVVRQIPLQSGTESITVEGGALLAGVYYYSLYAGNGLVDTKKMVLTK